MPRSRIPARPASAVALACLTLGGAGALVSPASSVASAARHAGKHTTVTVEVLGKPPASKVLVKRKVTLPAKRVVKDGGSCSGDSAAGALQLATKGRWGGTWEAKFGDYEVTKIEGIYLPFESKAAANWYWSFLVNGKEASAGVCGTKPKRGEKLLFKPACFGKACPKLPSAMGSALAAEGRRRA
jgi:Domain of unknown function (DUF4430)